MHTENNSWKRSQTIRAKVGIVHLGLGAFFRAHGAIYISEAMAANGGDWGICGASLRSASTRDALAPQDFIYTALEAGPEGDSTQQIEVIDQLLVAPEDPAKLLEVMGDPAVKIVSLTVTEKGYCHHPATGQLNLSHPDIQHDINHALPRSAPGFLVRALAARRAAGLRPFTVLSCDNLPENGTLVRTIVLQLAQEIDSELADWIDKECCFPATMIDRIVPATQSDDLIRVAKLIGKTDAAPVIHEPFRQWVIEDEFVDQQRPDFAAAGVQLVDNVAPFELMKLRMLNGSHSALAYLGYLAGHQTISDTVADPVFSAFVQKLWHEEITPTLTAPPGTDLGLYASTLLSRYQNSAIQHRTWQIAMDGSQKLPQRLLGTWADARVQNRDCPGLALSVAAWMRYVGGVDEQGKAIDVRDPLASELKQRIENASSSAEAVAQLLAVREIFPEEIAEKIAAPVTQAYESLLSHGARVTTQHYGAS